MYREYFITTPVILNKTTFALGDCRIVMMGTDGRSYVEGPTREAVGIAFDFYFALRDKARIPGLRIWLRSAKEDIVFPKEPRQVRGEDWSEWAFSQIPLQSMPGITLSSSECESVQQEISTYSRKNLERGT